MVQPMRVVSRRAVAAGPTSRAVDKMAPMARGRQADRHRQRHHEQQSHHSGRHTPHRSQVAVDRHQQQRPKNHGHDPERDGTEHGDGRNGVGSQGEDGPEQDLLGGTAGCARRRVEVEKQGGQADRGAEHDPGGQVTTTHPLDADHVHHSCPDHPEPHEPKEGAHPDENGAGTAGCRHIGEGVAGKGLAAQHGAHSDHGRNHRRRRPDDQGDVNRLTGEEPRLEDPGQ